VNISTIPSPERVLPAPTLREILACPTCRKVLTWDATGCVCPWCSHRYPITQGVPVVLPPESQESLSLATDEAENTKLHKTLAGRPWLRRVVAAMRPPLPYDRAGRWHGQRLFEEALPSAAGRRPVILDVGAGEGRDDQLAGLSKATRAAILRTDIFISPRVDFVSDAHRIPLCDGTLDGVVLQGVVEHVARPWVIAAEIVRALKPGGVVYCEGPFVQWYHEDPKDYYRFTEDGLKELFSGCDVLHSGVAIGPVGAVIGISRELLPILFAGPYLYWPLKWLVGWLTTPFVLLDRFYRRRPRAKTIALGVYVVMRKPAAA